VWKVVDWILVVQDMVQWLTCGNGNEHLGSRKGGEYLD
jgi:hypothetical protein